jgi:hypothetical protein
LLQVKVRLHGVCAKEGGFIYELLLSGKT